MSGHIVILTSIALAVSLVGSVQAQKPVKPGGGGNTLYPVTAEFRCPMTSECHVADGIEGDSLGAYRGTTPNGSATTQEGAAENMGAYLTEGNLFLFVLKSGFGRFASFNFSQPTGTAPCAANRTCRSDSLGDDERQERESQRGVLPDAVQGDGDAVMHSASISVTTVDEGKELQ